MAVARSLVWGLVVAVALIAILAAREADAKARGKKAAPAAVDEDGVSVEVEFSDSVDADSPAGGDANGFSTADDVTGTTASDAGRGASGGKKKSKSGGSSGNRKESADTSGSSGKKTGSKKSSKQTPDGKAAEPKAPESADANSKAESSSSAHPEKQTQSDKSDKVKTEKAHTAKTDKTQAEKAQTEKTDKTQAEKAQTEKTDKAQTEHVQTDNMQSEKTVTAQTEKTAEQASTATENPGVYHRDAVTPPPSKNEKAAIVYSAMLRSPFKSSALVESLASVERFFNKRYRYPVIVFHDHAALPTDLRDRIVNTTTASIDLIYVPTLADYPLGFNDTMATEYSRSQNPALRRAARFWLVEAHKRSELEPLDYVWRLAEDSLILETIGYDVFRHMRLHQTKYGYRADPFRDRPESIPGLWLWVMDYVEDFNIKHLRKIEDWPQVQIQGTETAVMVSRKRERERELAASLPMRSYMTGFELLDMNFWRTDMRVRKFARELDFQHRLLKNHWLDGNLRWILTQLLLKDEEMRCFGDIQFKNSLYFRGDTCRQFSGTDPFSKKQF
jgi:hypothetical protein